jgi:hypothetical protein
MAKSLFNAHLKAHKLTMEKYILIPFCFKMVMSCEHYIINLTHRIVR